MRILKSFGLIFDRQTVLISALAVLSTFLCRKLEFYADMPTNLIAIAIIFPIVFSINSAYRRREEVLNYFASLKARAVALYYAHRDIAQDDPGEHEQRGKQLLHDLLQAIKEYFIASPETEQGKFTDVYSVFSRYSQSHELLRKAGVPAPNLNPLYTNLSTLVMEFEKMRNIMLYRTPISLRAYSQVFLNLFPIVYGPYFANLCVKSNPLVGYGVAILYSIILVSLDNIQEDLECPFDMKGEDDVQLDVTDAYMQIIEASDSVE